MRWLGQTNFRTKQPQFLLSIESGIPNRFIPNIIDAFVFGNILGPGMERVMGCRVGQV